MYKIIGADQKQYGPVSVDELRRWIAEGRVNAQTLVQAEGQTDWRPLATFPEFAGAVPTAPAPIASPYAAATPGADARGLVSGPATALMIFGILLVLGALWGIASHLLGLNRGVDPAVMRDLPPPFVEIIRITQGPLGLVMNVIGLLLGAFEILASTKLRKLESYGLVMTASILAMVPWSCCCCVGLPIGIWILVVLAKPEVKSAFH